MANKHDYIAVFDSGIGGISVLRELFRQMPRERFLYYGDIANAPYGTRSTGEVRALTFAAVEKLLERGVKAVVIACNTATAAAIEALRKAYPELIIVGIEPALKLAADRYPNARVGVLATPLTLREEKFSHLAERFPQMTVHSIPLPGLVEHIESGATDKELEGFLEPLLAPYKGKLDAAVLGCTHYPLAAKAIGSLLGKETVLLDGAEGTARETKRRLCENKLNYEGPGEIFYDCSGGDKDFLRRCGERMKP